MKPKDVVLVDVGVCINDDALGVTVGVTVFRQNKQTKEWQHKNYYKSPSRFRRGRNMQNMMIDSFRAPEVQ